MNDITIDNKKYRLNVDAAIDLGVMEEIIPDPIPGNVYKFPGAINPMVLVQATYNHPNHEYQLCGIGCGPNSNTFYSSIHSMREIVQFLIDNKAKLCGNINLQVISMVVEMAKNPTITRRLQND